MKTKALVFSKAALLLVALVVAQVVSAAAQTDDQSAVKVAATEIMVVNAEAAYGNVTLPTNINGATVTWSSGNEKLVTASGVVTRPKDRDANVVLHATITKGAATASKEITIRVVKAFEKAVDEAYLFVHFTFTDEKIYFSLSKGNSALDWHQLNSGKPIFHSTFGTKGLRDPSIVRSPDGDTFYLMATDLKWFGKDKGNDRKRYIQVWESHDLVNWSAQRDVLVSPPNVQNTFAPEAVWDESIGAYVVFWTSKLGSNSFHTPMYATTRDFVTFTEAQVWQPDEWRIDSTVSKVGDWYYRFTKSHDKTHGNCHDIVEERSKNLRASRDQWETVDYCIGAKAGINESEAPLAFKANTGDVDGDYYYLWMERWIPDKTYVALRTKDFANPKWEVVPVNFPDPLPKHGTILPITAAEAKALAAAYPPGTAGAVQTVKLNGDADGKRFDGIGVVNGGGATAVLLKDYPEPQRSQILDLVYKPKFGASVSALLVEIPGDGNSTQGSMPSHMRTRDDLDYSRGYIWWILQEAKKRNPDLTLDAAAWSAPGWIGENTNTRFKREHTHGDAAFWSPDAVDYYVKWLQGLRSVYGLELDAIGCRNEKGVSYEFVKALRKSLNENGFKNVKVHAFDNWPKWKFDFVKDMLTDAALRDAIDVISGHVMYANGQASAEVQAMAAQMDKPIWNSEDHVYLKGYDCAISIVECFNENFIKSGATKIVNWYDIAGVYPMEPYAEDPATILAHSPWSGHYQVREALWGYAHYGQFSSVGWQYLTGGCGKLNGGGSFVTLKSPGDDYSIIIETKGAKAAQQLRFQMSGGLSTNGLCVWRSNVKEQFIRQTDIQPVKGEFVMTLEPDSIYSLSTTTGQQKGSFANIPAPKPFPFPYHETFEDYPSPKDWGYLPRYTADIEEVFELAARPDGKGKCLRQVIPIWPIFWAPSWRPYTILGDENWQDYEVSTDVFLNPGDTAGVMGRVNHVGTGYGTIPKGYFLQLNDQGQCELVVVRGKKDKKKAVGDAEQQRLIAALKDDSEGGEKVLATNHLANIRSNEWHNLKLRFEGSVITALVDEKIVLVATNNLYSRGMAGLLAGAEKQRLSMPYFDNVLIKAVGAPVPKPATATPGQSPIYQVSTSRGRSPASNAHSQP